MYSQETKVYYEDTDAGGVVYHSQYLNFMERCRSDWLESLGFDVAKVEQKYGVVFAVRKAEIDFIAPAVLRDKLTITCQTLQVGKIKLVFKQNVYNNDCLLCSATIKIATLDKSSFTLAALPIEMMTVLKNSCDL